MPTNLFNHKDAVTSAKALARDLRDAEAARWFEKVAARWLRQREDCAVPVPPGTPDLPEWAAADIAAGRMVHRFVMSGQARDTLLNVVHWLKVAKRAAKKPDTELGAIAAVDLAALPKTSVDAAWNKANAWFRREANAARKAVRASGDAHALEILPAPDKHVWERVSTRGMIEVGTDLLNCLRHGTYAEDVNSGNFAIWALRAPDGRYVAALTVARKKNAVIECKGVGNKPPYAYGRHVHRLMSLLGLGGVAYELLHIGITEGAYLEDVPTAEPIDDDKRLVWLRTDGGRRLTCLVRQHHAQDKPPLIPIDILESTHAGHACSASGSIGSLPREA